MPACYKYRQVHAPYEAETEYTTNAKALRRLIDAAYSDIKARVEHGQIDTISQMA